MSGPQPAPSIASGVGWMALLFLLMTLLLQGACGVGALVTPMENAAYAMWGVAALLAVGGVGAGGVALGLLIGAPSGRAVSAVGVAAGAVVSALPGVWAVAWLVVAVTPTGDIDGEVPEAPPSLEGLDVGGLSAVVDGEAETWLPRGFVAAGHGRRLLVTSISALSPDIDEDGAIPATELDERVTGVALRGVGDTVAPAAARVPLDDAGWSAWGTTAYGDVAIYRLEGDDEGVARLASRDPKRRDWVWVVVHQPVPAQVFEVRDHAFFYRFPDGTEPFSADGAPVVDAEGRVVGVHRVTDEQDVGAASPLSRVLPDLGRQLREARGDEVPAADLELRCALQVGDACRQVAIRDAAGDVDALEVALRALCDDDGVQAACADMRWRDAGNPLPAPEDADARCAEGHLPSCAWVADAAPWQDAERALIPAWTACAGGVTRVCASVDSIAERLSAAGHDALPGLAAEASAGCVAEAPEVCGAAQGLLAAIGDDAGALEHGAIACDAEIAWACWRRTLILEPAYGWD